jgi:hypothetical protein
MWVKDLVKFLLVLQFILISCATSHIDGSDESSIENEEEPLPNIWEDENVSRMVREVLAQDLVREHELKRSKRQHKRDVQSSVTNTPSDSSNDIQMNRKIASLLAQRTKKPAKVTQTTTKNKNRVTTRATSKTTTKPVANTSTQQSAGLNASKTKVRVDD